MARVVLGPAFQDMRGQIGTIVIGRWKGLNWARLKATQVSNPTTKPQGDVRSNLTRLVHRWQSLTDEQRALWEEYAQARGTADDAQANVGSEILHKGFGKLLSGFNAYISVNQLLLKVGYNIVDTPPSVITLPKPRVDNVTWDASTGITVTVYLEPDATIPKPLKGMIWMKGPRVTHPQIAAITPEVTTAGTVDVVLTKYSIGMRRNHGPFSLLEPMYRASLLGFYYFQVTAVDVQGKIGSPSNVMKIKLIS